MLRITATNVAKVARLSIRQGRTIHTSSVLASSQSSPRSRTEWIDTNTATETAQTQPGMNLQNEKAWDPTPDPSVSYAGKRTYVVAEADPANTPHDVPAGAFPTSGLYVNFKEADSETVAAVEELEKNGSSASNLGPHPNLTQRVQHNESGVGDSAAVRHATAPGEMGAKGGSFDGRGLADSAGTSSPAETLADRNPPPLQGEASKFSKAGLEGAWKERK